MNLPGPWRARLRRDVRARWGQSLALALAVSVVVMLVPGAFRARRLLAGAVQGWTTRLAFADLELHYGPTAAPLEGAAAAVPGVAEAEQRLLLPARVELPPGRSTAALLRVLPDGATPRLDRLEVLEGRLPAPGEAALVVDRSLVRLHGTRLGDRLTLELESVRITAPVVGVALSPEHLLYPLHPEYPMPARGSLAVLHVSPAALVPLRDVRPLSDSLLVRLQPGADAVRVEAALLAALPVSALGATRREDHPTLRLVGLLFAAFDAYLPPVALTLAVVTLALLTLAVRRAVRRRRSEIGTLLALGHGGGAVAASFLPVALIPASVGAALGAAFHRSFAADVVAAYDRSLAFAPPFPVETGPSLPATIAVCLAVSALAAWLPAAAAAGRPPQRLLRGASPPGGRRGALARAGAWAARALALPAAVRLGLSNAVRGASASLASILGLGSLFAVVTAFVTVHVTYERETLAAAGRVGLDAVVRFREPQGPEAVERVAQASRGRAEPIVSLLGLLTARSGPVPVRLVGAPAGGEWLRGLRVGAGRGLPPGPTLGAPPAGPERLPEVLVDRWVADEQGLGPGDRVRLCASAQSPDSLEAEVAGVVDGLSAGQVYLPLATAQSLFVLGDRVTGVQVRSALPPDALEAALGRLPGVEQVHPLGSAVSEVLAAFEGGRTIMTLALALAVLVTLLFLGVTATLDGHERRGDGAVLDALGWSDGARLTVVATEVLARGLLAVGVGLAAAQPLAEALLQRLASANHFPMDPTLPGWLPPALLGAVALALPLAALPAWGTALQVPPARTLRRLSDE